MAASPGRPVIIVPVPGSGLAGLFFLLCFRRLPGVSLLAGVFLLQVFIGGLPVHTLLVFSPICRTVYHSLAGDRIDRTHQAARGEDKSTLDYRRTAFLIEKRHQGFAYRQLSNYPVDGVIRILAEGFRRRLDGLLVPGGVGSQGVLDPVAQLAQNLVGDIDGFCNEVNAHSLERTSRTTC